MQNCLIISNTYKEESKNLASEIKDYLECKKVSSRIFEFDGKNGKEAVFEGFDFVITLGGDGTVIFASKGCAKAGIPVFPVNLGSFGFIAGVEKSEWKDALEKFLAGKAEIVKRSMVEAELIREGKTVTFEKGLNEILIGAETATRTISFEVIYDKVPLGTIKADGVIVATATGSTAYSASAGGPIIDTSLDALVLTLVNPFSLSTRPVVLSGEGEILIKLLPSRCPGIIMTVDGETPVNLMAGDVILIRKNVDEALLVGCTKDKFYNALRSKMNWMGGPRA